MRMFRAGLQSIEIDDVDESNLQILKVLPEDGNRCQRLLRHDVSGTGHDDVWLRAIVRTCPVPYPSSFGAVHDRVVHIEIDKVRLFVGDNHIDIIRTPQTMVGYAQQTVRVGRKIDASNLCALIADEIQKARILVREAIMVLSPN